MMRKHLTLSLLLSALWGSTMAQQYGTVYNDDLTDGFSATLMVNTAGTPGCVDHRFSTMRWDVPHDFPVDDSQAPPYYFVVPASAPGSYVQSAPIPVHVVVDYPKTQGPGGGSNGGWPYPSWLLNIDHIPVSAAVVSQSVVSLDENTARYTGDFFIVHELGDAWSTNGVRHVTMNFMAGGWTMGSIRFKVIFVGSRINDPHEFVTPQAPVCVLHDPPGDQSYSTLSTSQEVCSGRTYSVSSDTSANVWGKAKVGCEGSVGFFGMSTDYSVYAEAGVNATAGQTENSNDEYTMCFTASSTVSTSQQGEPDDVFFGSAIRYRYGFMRTITATGCGTIQKSIKFVMEPVGVMSSYFYTEYQIRNTVLPDLDNVIAQLPPGSTALRDAINQRNVWIQTLALNDEVRTTGPAVGAPVAWNGGGAADNQEYTATTSASHSITYSVYLDAAISTEYAAEIGGSGVSGGSEIALRTEYGQGQSQSNTTTNSLGYTFQDDDHDDYFYVQVRKDPYFGTFAFELDSAVSRTSCPYEGGTPLDQPTLSVGSPGQTSMVIENATIGSNVIFPLILCNDGPLDRTYYIKYVNSSNTEGGIFTLFGNQVNGNDNGADVDLAAGECLTVNLVLTPVGGVLNYDDIQFYLYSLCEPSIRSLVHLTAHYGNNNPVVYCDPTDNAVTSGGDLIDGVQLGDINNTNSGGLDGDSYVDLTGQFSTTLASGGNYMLTITSGSYSGDHYAAWIDLNNDKIFSQDEKIGEFSSPGSFAPTDITFTVPNTAAVGATRLRVRCTWPFQSEDEPLPLDACYPYFYGETEDYAITISAGPPIDCLGAINGQAQPGSGCDDGNANTGADHYDANCVCAGYILDCAGIPGGDAQPGGFCDDGNSSTTNDLYDAGCNCIGDPLDCLGNVNGNALPGAPCDDADPETGNDVYGNNCVCAGEHFDCAGVPGGNALPGETCDDDNALSSNDVYNSFCLCAGTLTTDCNGVAGGPAQPGTLCDDGDPGTGLDAYTANCICAGLQLDCNGIAGGLVLPGASCNDLNPATVNDVVTASCVCLGTLSAEDCQGVPGGSAQPGTTCDDGDPDTGNDVFNAFCQCVGETIDCNGNAGGNALPGFACNDGNEATGADVFGNDCVCSGQPIDCNNVPGGAALPGTGCDDGNAQTTDDVYNNDCVCAGLLPNDCLGVPGGSAQPGTACDDGDANTGNDAWTSGCACIGLPLDCAGVPGGTAVPGSACDDGDACTNSDQWNLDCTCTGAPLQVGAVIGNGTIEPYSTNTYYIDPVPGATAYSWELPTTWSSDNTSTFVLTVTSGSVLGPVQLCVTAFVGACPLENCLTIDVIGSVGVTSNSAEEEWLSVQPNPSNGLFQLLPGDDRTAMSVTVHDGTGRQVHPMFTVNGKRTALDLHELADGAYYLIATRNDDHRVLKLIVQH